MLNALIPYGSLCVGFYHSIFFHNFLSRKLVPIPLHALLEIVLSSLLRT